jgi:ribosomal protein S3AE
MAVLKKHWVPILAPTLFRGEQLGESYVLETDSLKTRGISVNLMNITGDMKKQGFSVSFRIVDVKEGKAHTRTVGIDMQPSSIKRLVRRGRSKIDDSFLVQLKGGQVARIKPLTITKSLTNNSTVTAVRVRAREVLQELCKDLTFETLISDVVNMKLQRHLRTQLDKIYPIRSVDIRSCRLMPKFTLDAEQPVEDSSYVPAVVVEASEDDAGERS